MEHCVGLNSILVTLLVLSALAEAASRQQRRQEPFSLPTYFKNSQCEVETQGPDLLDQIENPTDKLGPISKLVTGTNRETGLEASFDAADKKEGLSVGETRYGRFPVLPGVVTTVEQSLGNDPECMSIIISQRGLDYVKEILLQQILQQITPLRLPDIKKNAYIPIVGQVDAVLRNITLVKAEVTDSNISLENSGITITGHGVHANIMLRWQYKYYVGWIPIPISDRGRADVKVRSMNAWVTVNLEERDGGLSLKTLQCGTYVRDLEIDLHGGASWLYQWLIDIFEDRMRATVEDQLTAQIKKGIKKLDSLLFSLPRQVSIDETAGLDFRVVRAPILNSAYVSIGVKGLFMSLNSSQIFPSRIRELPAGLICSGDMKMLTIALSESVLSSAAAVYYNAGLLNWLVDKMPDQSYLNTAKWRILVPQLYTQYPDEDMKLVFTVLSPPNISVTSKEIQGVAAANLVIQVLDKNMTTSVACISITLSLRGIAAIIGNNITAKMRLSDLSLKQEWSHVGNFRLKLVKVILQIVLKDALIPILNLSLKGGFPLPLIPSVELQNSDINYGNGYILVCTDAQYIE
eukprot:c28652_g1_i2 orf=473-2203(-)